jgi:hypothetical protein
VPDDPSFADLAGQWESYLENYKLLAKELHICIAPGTIVQRVKDEKTGKYKLLNVATFISWDGVLGMQLLRPGRSSKCRMSLILSKRELSEEEPMVGAAWVTHTLSRPTILHRPQKAVID